MLVFGVRIFPGLTESFLIILIHGSVSYSAGPHINGHHFWRAGFIYNCAYRFAATFAALDLEA